MKPANPPIIKDLLLIGGGHSHVIVLKRLGMRPLPGVRVTVICREVDTPYSGMLPGFVAGHYDFDDIHIDLGPLCQFAGARLYHDEVIGLDPERRVAYCRHHPPVAFDVASIDVGSTPSLNTIDTSDDTAIAVKPISTFVDRWHELSARVDASQGPVSVAVVGAGAGGTELLLAARHGLRQQLQRNGDDPDRLCFHLFAAGPSLLETHPPRVRARFERLLRERGVSLHLNAPVVALQRGVARTADGSEHAVDEVMLATAAGAQPWLAESGLEVDKQGFVAVRPTLESVSHCGIFATGDCAAVLEHPREKAGVFAVRQGPALDRNLRRALGGRRLLAFRPQRRFLSLISTGDRSAVASRGGWLVVGGAWVWRWKDRIDRRFMSRFRQLPAMAHAPAPQLAVGLDDAEALKLLSASTMRCGGCGAKVGATVLERVMAELVPATNADVLVGLHEPDDAAVLKLPAGKLLVQTVDSFRAMIDDPFVFGRIAANHALGDIYAMGAEPHSALAIVSLPLAAESKLEEDLRQLMRGALEVFDQASVTLVGGHTGEAAELALGFAVNGLVSEHDWLSKSGLRPGQRLVLTKPLGTGTLFAAHMRGRARARWISSALAHMQQPSQAAAECLRAHGADACTDVTGFGLLGHLLEMARHSEVDVELDLQHLPLLEGAAQSEAAGIASSLQPQNLRLRRAIRNLEAAHSKPGYAMLFDPQTAGGLLAGIPKDQAGQCVHALQQLGYEHASIIGRVTTSQHTDQPIVIRVD